MHGGGAIKIQNQVRTEHALATDIFCLKWLMAINGPDHRDAAVDGKVRVFERVSRPVKHRAVNKINNITTGKNIIALSQWQSVEQAIPGLGPG